MEVHNFTPSDMSIRLDYWMGQRLFWPHYKIIWGLPPPPVPTPMSKRAKLLCKGSGQWLISNSFKVATLNYVIVVVKMAYILPVQNVQ